MSDPPSKPAARRTPAQPGPKKKAQPSASTQRKGGQGNAKSGSEASRKRRKKPATRARPQRRKPADRAPKRKASRSPASLLWRGVLVAGAAITLVVGFLAAFILYPGPGSGKPAEIEWRSPASARDAANQLETAGLVRSPSLMALYMALDGNWRRIDPGLHLVQDDMSARTLLRRLRRLPGGATVRVPIPEGFNKLEVARRLHERGVCSKRGLIAATTDSELLAQLRIPAPDAEGYLFPATYDFPRNHAPTAVLRRMVNESTKRHAHLFDEHADAVAKLQADLGWTRHSILVLASIVEKETGVDEERPIVASVFLNRMYSESFRPRQRLQSDPTARYGCLIQPEMTPTCAGADTNVTGPMVRDPLNPYSTYAHSGLPPGPICNPGEASLRAVLAPADTDYLYFVAKGGGRHVFSKDYDDHRAAIRRGKRADDEP